MRLGCQGKAPIETALRPARETRKAVPGTGMGRMEEELKRMGRSLCLDVDLFSLRAGGPPGGDV